VTAKKATRNDSAPLSPAPVMDSAASAARSPRHGTSLSLGVEAIHGRATAQDVLLMTAFLAPFLIFWFAYSMGLRWLMWVCTLGYAIWLALQVKTWWVAYAFGASDSWMRVYRRVFSKSTQLLPSFGRHLPPDGMHLVLQVLLTAAVVLALVGLLKTPVRVDSA
jgi:hypothetical protein